MILGWFETKGCQLVLVDLVIFPENRMHWLIFNRS